MIMQTNLTCKSKVYQLKMNQLSSEWAIPSKTVYTPPLPPTKSIQEITMLSKVVYILTCES